MYTSYNKRIYIYLVCVSSFSILTMFLNTDSDEADVTSLGSSMFLGLCSG